MADPKHCVRIVNHNSASRSGGPFGELNRARNRLPTATQRLCTHHLKIQTVNRYIRRHLGWDPRRTRRVVGFRHDEPRRWMPKLYDSCEIEFPMVHAGVTAADVRDFWTGQPFDFALPNSDYSNCALCFMKRPAVLVRLIREQPSLADWWIEEEERGRLNGVACGLRDPRQAMFMKKWSYAELKARALSEQPVPLDEDGEETDCACTD